MIVHDSTLHSNNIRHIPSKICKSKIAYYDTKVTQTMGDSVIIAVSIIVTIFVTFSILAVIYCNMISCNNNENNDENNNDSICDTENTDTESTDIEITISDISLSDIDDM